MATLKYKEGGVVKELILPASGIKLLDIENNFQSKNLEEVLKEIGETESVYLGEIDPNKEGIWFDSSDQLNTGEDNTVVSRIKDYINDEVQDGDEITTSSELTTISEELQKQVKVSVSGKTVFNILGSDGNCEDISKFTADTCTLVLDGNRVFGNNGIKFTLTGTGSSNPMRLNIQNLQNKLDKTKYYCLSAYIKNYNISNSLRGICFGAGGGGIPNTKNNFATAPTDKFIRVWTRIQPSDIASATSIEAYIWCYGTAGQYGYVDGIMIEEITSDQYNDTNFVPSPYTDNDLSVGDAPTKIKTRGKNLINLVQGLNSNPSYVGFGHAPSRLIHKETLITVKPNTTYTVSLDKPLLYVYTEFDINLMTPTYTWSATTSTGFTFTTGANTRWIAIAFKIDDTTPIYAEDYKIQLEEGSVATTYEPYQETCVLVDKPLRGLQGGVKDTIENGKFIQRVGAFVLDGGLAYHYNGGQTGFKRIGIGVSNYVCSNLTDGTGISGNIMVKYNGKILNDRGNYITTSVTKEGVQFWSNNNIYIDIPNSESGWGDSYSPSNDEIKAYFYGWSMYISGGYTDTIYNGTGTKAWVQTLKRGVNGDASIVTYTCPTTQAPNYYSARLYYKLYTSQISELNYSDLIAYSNICNLTIESNSQSFIRPTVKYMIYDTLKTNINKLEKGFNDNKRLVGVNTKNITQISNPNLLINGDFKMWQRGTGIFSVTNNRAYTVDRWRTGSDNGTLLVKKYENGVNMTLQTGGNMILNQPFLPDDLDLRGKTVTLSCKGSVSSSALPNLNLYVKINNAWQLLGTTTVKSNEVSFVTCNIPSNCYIQQYNVEINTTTINSGSVINMEWVKLELGSIPTPFVPKDYGKELIDCQRYYQRMGNGITGFVETASNLLMSFQFITPMRVAPTITMIGTSFYCLGLTNCTSIVNYACTYKGVQYLRLGYTSTNRSIGNYVYVDTNSDVIALDAEIYS